MFKYFKYIRYNDLYEKYCKCEYSLRFTVNCDSFAKDENISCKRILKFPNGKIYTARLVSCVTKSISGYGAKIVNGEHSMTFDVQELTFDEFVYLYEFKEEL